MNAGEKAIGHRWSPLDMEHPWVSWKGVVRQKSARLGVGVGWVWLASGRPLHFASNQSLHTTPVHSFTSEMDFDP